MKLQRLAALALFLLASGTLQAQDQTDITRKGFVLGASLGGGVHLSEGTSYSRFTAPNLKIGAMLNPRLGIIFYAPGGTFTRENEERAFEGFFPTVQYWITDKFFVNTGVGVAVETTPFYRVDFEAGPPEFNTGFGFTFSAGHEIIQWSENKTIDIQLRLLYGNIKFQDDSREKHLAIDLVFGFNLY